MRKKMRKHIAPENYDPGFLNLEYLAAANVDVAKAVQFCEIMGVKLEPLKAQLSGEIICGEFYSLLYDYISAIELCLLAGVDMGNKVQLIHPNCELAEAAMAYTVSLPPEILAGNVLLTVRKMKIWLSQKIEEEF